MHLRTIIFLYYNKTKFQVIGKSIDPQGDRDDTKPDGFTMGDAPEDSWTEHNALLLK